MGAKVAIDGHWKCSPVETSGAAMPFPSGASAPSWSAQAARSRPRLGTLCRTAPGRSHCTWLWPKSILKTQSFYMFLCSPMIPMIVAVKNLKTMHGICNIYIYIYAAMGEVNPPHEVPVSSLPKCGIAFCGLLRLLVQVRWFVWWTVPILPISNFSGWFKCSKGVFIDIRSIPSMSFVGLPSNASNLPSLGSRKGLSMILCRKFSLSSWRYQGIIWYGMII